MINLYKPSEDLTKYVHIHVIPVHANLTSYSIDLFAQNVIDGKSCSYKGVSYDMVSYNNKLGQSPCIRDNSIAANDFVTITIIRHTDQLVQIIAVLFPICCFTKSAMYIFFFL